MTGTRSTRWVVAVPMAALALATIYPLVFTANVAMKTRREYTLDRFMTRRDDLVALLGGPPPSRGD